MQLYRVLWLFVAASAACVVGDASQPADPTTTAALAVVQHYQTLAKISERPYASAVGSFEVATYIQGDAADYRLIHPDQSGSHANVARGTVIIRAVFDAGGSVDKLTVMAKGPAGYDPEIGDWWFGETDPSGAPLVQDDAPQVGRMEDCHGCHLTRVGDDYLFGVPGDDE